MSENRQIFMLVAGMLAVAALVVATITLLATAAADGGVERECSTLTECD